MDQSDWSINTIHHDVDAGSGRLLPIVGTDHRLPFNTMQMLAHYSDYSDWSIITIYHDVDVGSL